MYAIHIEIDTGEYCYVTGKNPFTIHDAPLLFENKEEAESHAKLWNTGRVVPYIMPMSKVERRASLDRSKANNNKGVIKDDGTITT
tara:strand:- start:736 stop:993 length:258 start_codon:yes stop_codon:yes gene_type:complete